MQRRDYILRLIEEIGAAVIALRNRILGRQDDPAEIEHALGRLAGQGGIDLSLLRGFSVDTLHMLVSPRGEVEPTRCWMMAELLYLDGLQARVEDRASDARESLGKAKVLYGLVAPAGGLLVGFPEADERRADIDLQLDGLGEDS